MLDLEAITRLNLTTQALYERCAANHKPYACLEEGLAELASQNWPKGAINQVRRVIKRLIEERDPQIFFAPASAGLK